MAGRKACEYRRSESLRSIYDNERPPINCGCVKLGFVGISALLPFSLLANSAFYEPDPSYTSIFYWATDLYSSWDVISASVFTGVVLAATLLYSSRDGRSWPPSLAASVVISLGYVCVSVAFDYLLTDSSFSLSFVGLASVHAFLLLLLGRRLTEPLTPDIESLDNPEVYLQTLRYTDRTTLAVGIGFIFGILFTLAPSGSGIKTRDTVALLSGPIALTLLLIIAVGIIRMRSLREQMDA